MLNEKPVLLFLDFDGVICDSLNECFLSSWSAYYHYFKKSKPLQVGLAERREFTQLRPFVRDGQDYLLIHELMERGVLVHSQEEFDTRLREAGEAKMQEYRRLFYRARNYFIENDFTFWCGLNVLFLQISSLLAHFAGHPHLYILSTKKPQYIAEILKYHRIEFDSSRILYPGHSSKIAVISKVLAHRPGCRAIFVDDQVDHFRTAETAGVETLLPAWGYIKKSWLAAGYQVLFPEKVKALFNSLLPLP